MTRLVLALVALTALAGCDSETIPVHLVEFGDLAEDRALVDEAAAILGLEARFVSWDYGAVQLTLRDECEWADELGRERCGFAQIPVTPVCHGLDVWSTRVPDMLAHELGHSLGLEHSLDAENIMFETELGPVLDDEQVDTIRDRAGLLNACR